MTILYRFDLQKDLYFPIVLRGFEILQIKKALLFQCSKLRVQPAPCVHILAAGCTDLSTCAPGVNMLFIILLPLNKETTLTNCWVNSFGYLRTWRVHNVKH